MRVAALAAHIVACLATASWTSVAQAQNPPDPGAEPAAATGQPSEGDPSPPAPGTGTPSATPGGDDVAPEARPTTIVIDAAPFAVAPVVGRVVTDALREGAESLGYAVPGSDATLAATQRAGMPFPPSTVDLWRVMWAARAQRALFARVWAQRDRYVVEVVVASQDGRGPFWARGSATPNDLRATVIDLVRQALPPPGALAPPPPETSPRPPETPSAQVAPAPAPQRHRRRRRRRRPSSGFFVLALGTEAAFGVSNEFFYNHLAGARLDYRVSRALSLGLALDYANLRGKNGRVSNVLPYAHFEYRLPLSSGRSLSIPLRFGLGYLPRNGVFVRMAGGLAIPLGRSVDVVFDLLAPTFWMLPTTTAVSLDVRVEMAFRL